MLGKLRHRFFVVGLLVVGVAFAMPLASAFGTGVDAASVPKMKNAGAAPQYGQTWVGPWMKSSGWGGFESDMRTMRDNGAIPVVMWYYWGDSISVNCVKYGCSGRTKGDWDAMARDMATRAKNIMGGSQFLVVLEPEFNKAGVSSYEDFDGYLANQARAIKAIAPNAKIVVGFGYWGGWDIFDRAVAASDYTGFQLLRGSTRDSQSTTLGAADQMISITKSLKSRFGKDVVMFDLAVATYGGWEWVQEKVLKDVQAKRGAMDAAGMRVLIWRYVYDNGYSSGYYGPAESTWGVKYSSGGNKAGYDDLVTLLRNGGTTSTTSTYTAPVSTSGFDASFTCVKAFNYWVQSCVSGTQSIAKVEVRVNGGAWQSLTKQSWGGWAKSFPLSPGSKVEFRATSTSGATDMSSAYWSS